MNKSGRNWKQILQQELEIWSETYPSQRKLLKKFADKIKFEISITMENDISRGTNK